MKSVAAIRTNKWTEEEQGLYARLTAVFGQDVYVVFHNRPEGTDPVPNIIDINNDWVAAHDLRNIDNWGWRCGDYAYYALREAVPEADFYWLIEPDVFFTSDPHGFFEACAGDPSDALGLDPGPFTISHRFTRGMRGFEHYRAIFALTRLSGRALDHLLVERQAYSALGVIERAYTNDEIFVFTHIAKAEHLSQGDLRALVPGWFEGTQFATNPELLDRILIRDGLDPERVWHPVRSMEYLKGSIVERLSTSSRFLGRMAYTLQELSPEDVDDIGTQVGEKVRIMLHGMRK